jgi:toll-like receptor 13
MVDQRVYEFDAFVIHCHADSNWVIHTLLPNLETTNPETSLRLCIHQRDWEVGADIAENIADSIQRSRKCCLIVSNAFATSTWGHVELTMAQTRLFTEEWDNVILVLMEEVAEINQSPRLKLQMQRQTYIEWTDSEVGQQLFWARLRQALRGPDQSLVQEELPRNMFVQSVNIDDD